MQSPEKLLAKIIAGEPQTVRPASIPSRTAGFNIRVNVMALFRPFDGNEIYFLDEEFRRILTVNGLAMANTIYITNQTQPIHDAGDKLEGHMAFWVMKLNVEIPSPGMPFNFTAVCGEKHLHVWDAFSFMKLWDELSIPNSLIVHTK